MTNKIESVLVKKQVKTFTKDITYYDEPAIIKVKIRYDDECGNGHNTFAITGEVWLKRKRSDCETCGCIHDLIAEHFPELSYLIKWHGCNSDGPLYYIENTTYHAEEHGATHAWIKCSYPNQEDFEVTGLEYMPIAEAQKIYDKNPSRYKMELDEKTIKVANLDAARSCAIWPDATIEQLRDVQALNARLPALMAAFRKDIEGFGFTY